MVLTHLFCPIKLISVIIKIIIARITAMALAYPSWKLSKAFCYR